MKLSSEFLESYQGASPNWGFNGLGELIFKRTYARVVEGEDRKEDWIETVTRCVEGAQAIGAGYTQYEMERLFDYVFYLKGTFAGRALWQLGTPLVNKFGGNSLINCWFTSIEKIEDFEFIFNQLMLGGGVGYSVERSRIHELPRVKAGVKITHQPDKSADFIVSDTREGWSRLLHSVLKSYFYTGKSFTYSTILVRGYGEILNTFGGFASGPQALIDGISDICKIFDSRISKKLRSVDVLDVVNIIGRIVVSGSSRRSAQLAGGDPDDYLFARAKNWGSGKIPAWRSNSNNSIYADSYDEITEQIWSGYDGSGEPYGLLNRALSQRTGRLGESADDGDVLGFNPCGEITLGSKEACNLSTIFLPNISSKEELVDLAILLYKTQKAMTSLSYNNEESERIIKKNRRLGLNITGWAQATEQQISWVSDTYQELKDFDAKWSAELGIEPSIKLTCVQPGGTLPLLAGCTAGTSTAYAEYIIRRVRFGSYDPLIEYCRSKGYPVETSIGLDGREDHSQMVVSFPCKFPKHTIFAKDLSAIGQLELVVKAQTLWSDNAVSSTIYYKKEELPEIRAWLKENYENKLKSVSFLLHSGHGFIQAPIEEITEQQYNKMIKNIKIDQKVEDTSSELLGDTFCEGGACPIR